MSINEKLRSEQNDELFTAILTLENTEECYAFFEDICTINELKALSQRLQVAKCYVPVIATKNCRRNRCEHGYY